MGWHLEVEPSPKYTTPGGSPTITCSNISGTTKDIPHNSQWYKISLSGTLQELSTEINARVRSDGDQLRISYARNADNGSYCCKGPTQDQCDESAIADLVVVVPPVIVSVQNQTVLVQNNVTLECIIENEGNPPFIVNRWQKSGERLVTDGTKYTSQLIGNMMYLTIVNLSNDDEGFYQCILETSASQVTEAFVYLSVDHERANSITNG